MSKIYEHTNKQFFIYDNVLTETLFNDIFDEVTKELDNGNQTVRFGIVNKKTQEIFFIDKKPYNTFTDYEKEMFHKLYDNDEVFELIRRDSDISVSHDLQQKLNTYISDIIKTEYNLKNVDIEYSSFIHYGPGHLMKIHSDATPHNPRLCTAVLYCNDMTENTIGGDVIFYDDEKSQNVVYTYTPKRNQLVIFDSYVNNLGIPHSVTKIENWNRYVYRVYFKTPTSL